MNIFFALGIEFLLVLGLIASQFAQDALYEEGANDDLNNYLFDSQYDNTLDWY